MAIVTIQMRPATATLTVATTTILHSSTAGKPTRHVSRKDLAMATRMKITVMLMGVMVMPTIMAMPTIMRTTGTRTKIMMSTYTITAVICIKTMAILMKSMVIRTKSMVILMRIMVIRMKSMVIRMKAMAKHIST